MDRLVLADACEGYKALEADVRHAKVQYQHMLDATEVQYQEMLAAAERFQVAGNCLEELFNIARLRTPATIRSEAFCALSGHLVSTISFQQMNDF
jgi:hypothetical protein